MTQGRIEVITGGMFSGKSEELVRRLRRAVIGKRKVKAFKHASDDRYHRTHIGCHTGLQFEAIPAKDVRELDELILDVEVVGIDEAQFFDASLVELCEKLANYGIVVIVAGLDLDSSGQPFGPMAPLMAVAEKVTKLHAVCVVCGDEACRSYHKGMKQHQVEVGADQYEARCRKCSRG